MTDNTSNSKPIWWISWYTPKSLGGFTLLTPWWVSGWAFDENDEEVTSIVAAVRADSEKEAFETIEAAYEEENVKIPKKLRRFCRKFEEGDELPWERESTRFSLQDWMEWK